MTTTQEIDLILETLRDEYSFSQDSLWEVLEEDGYAPVTSLIGLVEHQSALSILLPHAQQFDLAPCDLYLFAIDDELRPETCIGGIPYRPDGIPWPRNSHGGEMQFLAQFRLNDSPGASSYPGDILLVFIDHLNGIASDKDDSFFFEWYQLPYKSGLTCSDVSTPWNRRAGVRYCTHDVSLQAKNVVEAQLIAAFPDWVSFHIENTAKHVLCHHGVKVGGIPIEDEWPVGNRFLLSFCSIYVAPDRPYPWVNHPLPISDSDITSRDIIESRSGFRVNLFLDDANNITWRLSFY